MRHHDHVARGVTTEDAVDGLCETGLVFFGGLVSPHQLALVLEEPLGGKLELGLGPEGSTGPIVFVGPGKVSTRLPRYLATAQAVCTAFGSSLVTITSPVP